MSIYSTTLIIIILNFGDNCPENKAETSYSALISPEINKVGVLDTEEKPKAVDLASLLDFELKLQHKYDYLLTDELLNMEYAKSCLDIDGAWKVLENNFTRIK